MGLELRTYQYGNGHLKSATKNMANTSSHPTVLEEYIKDELSLSGLADPFHRHAIKGVR